jgi:polyphosphate kinase
MSEGVKKRKVGVPVRFVYDAEIPPVLLDKLMKKLRITEGDSLRGGSRYHNFKDFMHFPRFNNSDLFYKPFPPVPHPDLPLNKSIIAAIRERDLMLHFPYQSFQYIIDLLREASIDPQVKEIKMTFYRAAQDSSVINALINASRNGKMVTVFLELQARFDEEANIYWTNRLQEEGVKIIQTIPGFKVHCKLLLIRRREADDTELLYANISTGNYNEHTATVYSDDSLLTCHPGITNDVDKVFRLFESRYIPPKFKELIVAPFCIRDHIMEMLDNEIRAAQAGKEAWAIIKINSIVDTRVADKLYEASAAGVKIRMIVRGICILKGGVPGLSENIEISSIIDRFLEHSRIYVFCNKGRNKFYIGSADWMQRNFDHRIEVLCPVYDKNIQKELMTLLRYEIYDNTKSRDLSWGKINSYKSNPVREPIRSQFNKYQYFTELAIKSRKSNEKAKAAK